MSVKNINKLLEGYIAQIVDETGYELVDFEFIKEGQNWILRVFIDKEGGITIDNCETFSRKLEKLLDTEDPIQQAYMLEVSSPGIERPLKKPSDFVKYSGQTVYIKLFKAIGSKKEFYGELLGLRDGAVVIIGEDKEELSFLKTDIAVCRLSAGQLFDFL